MRYENIENIEDTNVYRQACEKVKKIVKAIKAIKIKYYSNFARISKKDKEVYDQLEENLEKISRENGLDNLKVALMEEVSARYDKKDMNENGDSKEPDNIIVSCYGAIDAQLAAMLSGKIGQAKKCQEILKQYLQEIEDKSLLEMITNYKREKFWELVRAKDEVQAKNEEWMKKMKSFCKPEDVQNRKNVTQEIDNLKRENKEKSTPIFAKTEDVLEIG